MNVNEILAFVQCRPSCNTVLCAEMREGMSGVCDCGVEQARQAIQTGAMTKRAVGNCYMMAKREIARITNGKAQCDPTSLERWQHVKRFCESAGAESSILRWQLPTELTDGGRETAFSSVFNFCEAAHQHDRQGRGDYVVKASELPTLRDACLKLLESDAGGRETGQARMTEPLPLAGGHPDVPNSGTPTCPIHGPSYKTFCEQCAAAVLPPAAPTPGPTWEEIAKALVHSITEMDLPQPAHVRHGAGAVSREPPMTPDALKAQIEQALRGMFEVWYPNDSLRVMAATTAAMNAIAPHLTPEAQGAQPPQQAVCKCPPEICQCDHHTPRPAGPHAGLVERLQAEIVEMTTSTGVCRDCSVLSNDTAPFVAAPREQHHERCLVWALREAATALQREPEPWTRQQVEALIKQKQLLRGLCDANCEGRCRLCPYDWVTLVMPILERYALLCPSDEPETR